MLTAYSLMVHYFKKIVCLAQTQYVFSAFLISRKMRQIIKDFFSPDFLEKGKSETAMIYGYPDLLSYLSPFKPKCNQSHY